MVFLLKLLLVFYPQSPLIDGDEYLRIVQELQHNFAMDDIQASESQKSKLKLLKKRQADSVKSISRLQERIETAIDEGRAQESTELSIELRDKLKTSSEQGNKLLVRILEPEQLQRIRQIVRWRQVRESGQKNSMVLGLCSEFGAELLELDRPQRQKLTARFGRSHAQFIEKVVGFRKAMESVIPAEKLKPIWAGDRDVKLQNRIYSSAALDYFAANYQGDGRSETKVTAIGQHYRSVISKGLSEVKLSSDSEQNSTEILIANVEIEQLRGAYRSLEECIEAGEFCRLSRRFLRKSLQEFKNGQKLNRDAAEYFGLSEDEVDQANAKYLAWQESQNKTYLEFQIQELEEFRVALPVSSRQLAIELLGEPPKPLLRYFETETENDLNIQVKWD